MDKKTRKKQEIIRASLHVMLEKGYNGTSIKDLTAAAGIPKGSLYNYFENKEHYAKEALYFYYNEMNKENFDILEDNTLDPLDRIKSFYRAMIIYYKDESQCKLGCFIGNLTLEMGGVNEAIREVTNEIHDRIVESIRKALEEAIKKGQLSKTKNIDILADFIASSWQGVLLRIKASNNKDMLDNFYKVLVEVLLK